MVLTAKRVSHGYLFALALATLAAFAAARADEPRTAPNVEPIGSEFHPADDEHFKALQDLKRTGQYPPPTFSTPGGLPPEILEIQQELGGSVVNQFPSLQAREALPQSESPSSPSLVKHRRQLVAALRDAAWSMDSWANRLEALEAYEQADELRAHAQRLRLAARPPAAAPAADAAAPQQPTSPDPSPAVEIFPAAPTTTPTELR